MSIVSIKRKKVGRPREKNFDALLGVSISSQDKAMIERAATKKFPSASSLSEAMRTVLVHWARRVLDEI